MATIKAPYKLLQLLKLWFSPASLATKIAAFIVLSSLLPHLSHATENEDPRARLQAAYEAAGSNYLGSSTLTNAVQFTRAIFELADISTNDTQRASIANRGIAMAQTALRFDKDSPAAHYYLGLNLGQLAQTKSLGALKLVRQMEQEFLASIALDPAYDHAGAHRSLGMLYRDTPGWPASIGSKSKAGEHLEKAVELAPDFPDNHLTLLEARLKWGDHHPLQSGIERYRTLLPDARQKYRGVDWSLSWHDWDHRWNEILSKAAK